MPDERAELPTEPPLIRTIAMPADTNAAGDIFGGWLMSQMDLAAGSAAARIGRGRRATVGIERIRSHKPVHVGDEVSVHATVARTGRTSITMDVQAWIRSRDGYVARMACDGTFTFVAIDSGGRPRVLGPVDVEGSG